MNRDELNKKLMGLKSERQSWEQDWRELQSAFMPFRGRFVLSETNRSQKTRINKIINNAGLMAVRTMRSGLMAGITNPSRPWFRLSTADPDMMKYRAVKEYLEITEKLMRDIFAQSNLYQVLPIIYGELGVFGTACMVAMPNFRDVLRFYPITIGQYYIAQNDELIVDTMLREFRLTAKQAMEKFQGNVSENIKAAYKNGNLSTQFDFVHAIQPNTKAMDKAYMGKDMAYSSVYFQPGTDFVSTEDGINKSGGFRQFNVMAPRWETTGEDVYGYGCGHFAIGDNSQLQVQEKRKAQAIDKSVSPPFKAPGSMKNSPIVGVPGGITYYDATDTAGPAGLSPLHDVGSRIDALVGDMDRVESRISRAFFEDLFLMIAQSDRREITAREIDERVEEKLLMLGPAMSSMNSELLDPLIAITYNECVENNLLPPPPEEIAGQSLKVEYVNPMAQAQKMVGIGAIERYIGFIGQTAEIAPEARYKLNAVQAADAVGEMLGVPQRVIRPDDEVKSLQESEAKAAQAAQAAQTGMGMTQAAEQLSKADMGDGTNLLQRLTGA